MDFISMILNHSTPLSILAAVIVITVLEHLHIQSKYTLLISIITGICIEILDHNCSFTITALNLVTGALSGMIAYFCYETILKLIKNLK
mgnify:CR=1 FL=1